MEFSCFYCFYRPITLNIYINTDVYCSIDSRNVEIMQKKPNLCFICKNFSVTHNENLFHSFYAQFLSLDNFDLIFPLLSVRKNHSMSLFLTD